MQRTPEAASPPPPLACTAWMGYAPAAVSPDSITQSVPSNTALATSVASARVGRGLLVMDSSICRRGEMNQGERVWFKGGEMRKRESLVALTKDRRLGPASMRREHIAGGRVSKGRHCLPPARRPPPPQAHLRGRHHRLARQVALLDHQLLRQARKGRTSNMRDVEGAGGSSPCRQQPQRSSGWPRVPQQPGGASWQGGAFMCCAVLRCAVLPCAVLRTCARKIFSVGISMPRSPRATMIESGHTWAGRQDGTPQQHATRNSQWTKPARAPFAAMHMHALAGLSDGECSESPV